MAKIDGYHHGDLRRALIDGAYELAREHGASQVSLRGLARRVGVSAPAVYHHFPDREALLRAVAGRALGDLAAAMRDGLRRARSGDPRRRIVALAQGYVEWALAEPQLFRLAFGPLRNYPGRPADPNALDLLAEEIDHLAVSGQLDPQRRGSAPVTIWATTHGLAALLVDGPLKPPRGRTAMRDMVSATLDTVLAGLGQPVASSAQLRAQASVN